MTAYPGLDSIVYNPSLTKVLNNLKLLDRLIYHSSALASLQGMAQLGETQLVDFIWREEVEKKSNGAQNGRFLMTVAERQADLIAIGVATAHFPVADLAPVESLRATGTLIVHNDKIIFSHDLYSDWARYKLLKFHEHELHTYLSTKHLASPLWARAIRLYALGILEQNSSSSRWSQTFERFNTTHPQDRIIQDTMLEAFFFAANSYALLKQYKEWLFADEGKIIGRLLKLFLIKATAVDPLLMQLGIQHGLTESEIITRYRRPIYVYWVDMLLFLAEEKDVLMKVAMFKMAWIAGLWLDSTTSYFECRLEAAAIAVAAAQFMVSAMEDGTYVEEEVEKVVYRALLKSYASLPDEVKALCLRICKRVQTPLKPPQQKARVAGPAIAGGRGFEPPPSPRWPLGPLSRVSSRFREICLHEGGLTPMMDYNPSLVSELLLALLIESPQRPPRFSEYPFNDFLCEQHEWNPPFFRYGPFYDFFKKAPQVALVFTCQLIGFVTDRWRERAEMENQVTSITVQRNGHSIEYIGNEDVLGWHKNVGNSSHVPPCLLKALQYYLYEKIEAGESIEADAEWLLGNSRSLAIVGVLFTVAKSSYSLFAPLLMPFLTHYKCFEWDRLNASVSDITDRRDFPSSWRKDADRWDSLSVPGNTNMSPIILLLIHRNKDFQAAFAKIRASWKLPYEEMLNSGKLDVYFLQLYHYLDPSNSTFVEGNSIGISYEEPKEVQDRLYNMRLYSNKEVTDNLLLPQKYQQIISEGVPLSLDDVDVVWQHVNNIYNKIDHESLDHCTGENAWFSPYTNLLGAVKVLVRYRTVWREARPEYEVWIKALITELVDKQFTWEGRFKDYGTSHDWCNSLAEIIPVFWVEAFYDKTFRRAVAAVILLFNQATRTTFFATCSQYLKWSHPAFIQTHNLLLGYSGSMFSCRGLYQASEVALCKAGRLLAKQFVEGSINTEPLNWAAARQQEQLDESEMGIWRRLHLGDYERKTDIYKEALTPLFSIIPPLKDVSDKADREYISFLYLQAMQQLLRKFDEKPDKWAHKQYVSDDFDRVIVRQIARSLLEVCPREKRRELWTRLFEFGYVAQAWIMLFCNEYLLSYLPYPSQYEPMIEELKEMDAFTSTAASWKPDRDYRHEDFRLCVLGLNPYFLSNWANDYSLFTSKSKAIYFKWFFRMRLNTHALKSLLDFMLTPSGAFTWSFGILYAAMNCKISMYLRQQPTPEKLVWVGNPELDDKLAGTFTLLSKTQMDEIKANASLLEAFKEVVRYLMSVQHPVGFELQNALLG